MKCSKSIKLAAVTAALLLATAGCGSVASPGTTAATEPKEGAGLHLDAARFSSLLITVDGAAGTLVTTRSVIREVVRLLDSAPAGGRLSGCQLLEVAYQLTLAPAVAGQPVVRVETRCTEVDVMVGGQPRPALRDNGVAALAAAVMHARHTGHQPVLPVE
jgi:hypothetical protein